MEEKLFDIHCHILPNVDDGSESLEETIELLEMEYEQGVRDIIVTPHFRYEMFETPIEEIREQYALVKKEADRIGIRLHLGCELHSCLEMTELLKQKKVSSMADSRYVLLEFSGGDTKRYIKERVNALLHSGYIPILAHIERYDALYGDFDTIEELMDMGALMQVNANSILGKDGFGVKRFCKKLMKYDMLSFVGSDSHDTRVRIPRIGAAYEYVRKKMGEDYADLIFYWNPLKIVKG